MEPEENFLIGIMFLSTFVKPIPDPWILITLFDNKYVMNDMLIYRLWKLTTIQWKQMQSSYSFRISLHRLNSPKGPSDEVTRILTNAPNFAVKCLGDLLILLYISDAFKCFLVLVPLFFYILSALALISQLASITHILRRFSFKLQIYLFKSTRENIEVPASKLPFSWCRRQGWSNCNCNLMWM